MTIILNKLYGNLNVKIKTKLDFHCIVELANDNDAEQILKCYNSVWISDDNIDEKIIKDSPNSFYNSGGIFNKLSLENIKEIINSKTNAFIISRGNDEYHNINALLWISINTDIYDNIILYDSIGQEKKDLINNYIKDKKIIYPMDFIALPDINNRGVSYPLLCIAYEKLYQIGYKYAFVEIYTLQGYFDSHGCYYSLEHSNKRSTILNKNICAENIGTIGVHRIQKGNYTIVTKSEIYGLDLETSINAMKDKTKGQILNQID